VHARQKSRSQRRGLLAVVAVVALITIGGIVLATVHAQTSQARLAQEQIRTQELLDQQLEYLEVTTLSREAETIVEARVIGASTEILWRDYMQAVSATVPEGSTITVLSVRSSSPMELMLPPTAPLQEPRVATLTLSLRSSDLSTVSAWIGTLPSLTGFADATLTTVQPSDAGVIANVTVNVNAEAFANRFVETEG
jgi:Tfp pilus assembly protein PilN